MADHNIEGHNEPSSLPVLTIADPELILASQDYAERVAIQALEYLMDLGNFRGRRIVCLRVEREKLILFEA